MTLFWSNSDYQLWILNGCDLNSASEVHHLELYFEYDDEPIPINFHAGLFKHFVNLRVLNLSQCGLTTIPEDVWELTELQVLYVNNNDICEISPKIKNLTNLQHFNCEENELTTFPVEICQLTKLSEFEFGDNKLDMLDKKVVDFVTKIPMIL